MFPQSYGKIIQESYWLHDDMYLQQKPIMGVLDSNTTRELNGLGDDSAVCVATPILSQVDLSILVHTDVVTIVRFQGHFTFVPQVFECPDAVIVLGVFGLNLIAGRQPRGGLLQVMLLEVPLKGDLLVHRGQRVRKLWINKTGDQRA